jgi:hypothetical protein
MAVCALACAQENTGNRVVISPRNGSLPHTVDASLIHGSITIKTGGSEIVAEVPGGPRRPERNVPSGMHRIDIPWRGGIQTAQNGDVVRITVGPEMGQKDLVITVPVSTSVRAHTMHGDVSVTGVHGEVDAASTHGEINLANVAGTVLANTVHGSITASMTQVDQSKPLSFITLNGSIDVTLPADTKMNLKLKDGNGEIWTDFDVKLTGNTTTRPTNGQRGRYRLVIDRMMRGTINGGGVDASFSTLNGRITIHKK